MATENLFLKATEAQAILASNPGTEPIITFDYDRRTLQAERRFLQSVARGILSDEGIVPVVVKKDRPGPPWLLIAGGLLILGLLTRRR